MSRERKLALQWAAGILAMGDALCRAWRMVTEGARFIDYAILIVDFLVLAVILWLDAPERFHKYKVRKKLLIVRRLLLDGNKLQQTAPPRDIDNLEVASQWVEAVKAWIESSYQTLAAHSMQAGLSFSRRNVEPDILYGVITHVAGAREWYRELLHRMNNLLNIMEKADVYF